MRKGIKFLAMMLVFAMFFSTMVSAAPTINEHGAIVAPDEDSPVEISIDKILQMPIGTITPDATFTFAAEPISVDGIAYNNDEDNPNMPPLNADNMTVSFDDTDTASQPDANNIITVNKPTSNIFAGVTFPHAGIYIYEITENVLTNPILDDEDNPHDFVSYSQAVYRIVVYVSNTEGFTGTFVNAVGIFQVALDDGTEIEGEGTKLPQITFTNDYVRTNGAVDPEDPDPTFESTLDVSKIVTGDLANKERYFNFSLTLGIPILVEDVPAYYRAYVVEDDVVIDPVNNADAALINRLPEGSLPYIRISTTGSTAFNLKHGQKLVFVDTPVGTSYIVEETGVTNYTPSFIITTNAVPGYRIEGDAGESLSTETQFVGHLANAADFTNNRTSVVPTGININNLPFYGLIALAIGAFIGFVAIKSRKRKAVAGK